MLFFKKKPKPIHCFDWFNNSNLYTCNYVLAADSLEALKFPLTIPVLTKYFLAWIQKHLITANVPGSGLWGLGSGVVDRTDVVDGSNERSWSTDQAYVERLMCPQCFLSPSSIFVGSGPEKVPQVKYFRKSQKLSTSRVSKENYHFTVLYKKKFLFFLFWIKKNIFSVSCRHIYSISTNEIS